jgi:SAM-dependent methyltransferase
MIVVAKMSYPHAHISRREVLGRLGIAVVASAFPELALSRAAFAVQQGSPETVRVPDTIYLPTPREVVTAMLEMANVGRSDVVYDLGSGDGRICIAAVKEFGARRAVGIELDDARIQEANENARRARVTNRVEFRRRDLFETDLREATVVALYLSVAINVRLHSKFTQELRPGARIVSHHFDMGDWKPVETRTVSGRMVYLWTLTGTR